MRGRSSVGPGQCDIVHHRRTNWAGFVHPGHPNLELPGLCPPSADLSVTPRRCSVNQEVQHDFDCRETFCITPW